MPECPVSITHTKIMLPGVFTYLWKCDKRVLIGFGLSISKTTSLRAIGIPKDVFEVIRLLDKTSLSCLDK